MTVCVLASAFCIFYHLVSRSSFALCCAFFIIIFISLFRLSFFTGIDTHPWSEALYLIVLLFLSIHLSFWLFHSCFVLIYENIVVVGVVSASSLKDCLRNNRLLLLPLLWVCLLFVLTPRELI